ncbi:uncharacterized protein LOC143856242 isoform X1 [Tasmannia lanceolata]|uniref:uncharacterized protein LOC143856242 isoform X1 n=2 Tax=Tasmannia lanceolata TaxID=3420 RepID=UPI004062CD2C
MEECSLYDYEMVPSNPWTSQNRRRRQRSWRPTVPSWEKKFCFSTCAISWKQLCDTKKRMYFYKNIAQWDDSSGEEAFLNAKARFWAEINGFPFDIPLPDPDIYTDEIDWISDIDLELPLDLDKKPLAPIDEEKDEKLGWDSFNCPIPLIGWGDDEDPVNDSKTEPSNDGAKGQGNADSDTWDWSGCVPSWVKKFCFSTCAILWKQLCDTKNLMSYYKNIAQWDDSSGEEAFQNAKARFWAEINGFPFDIPLPDPDIYTDEIDWNSDIDLVLPLDLDKKPPAPIDEEKDEKLGWDSFNLPIPCTGWGDDEDPFNEPSNCPIPLIGWGDDEDPVNDSPAEPSNCPIPCTGWVDAEDPVHDSPPEPTWGNFDQNVNNNIENRDVEQNSWENDGAKGQGNADSDTWDWSGCVASWEKKFCFSTCAISWEQLCDTKNLMSYYKNIAQWDDSSGEEAFQNAKARFWAEISGLPFDIPLPDPDIYTDEIDWNSDIDPELPLDLDKKPPAPIDEEKDEKLGWDSFNFPIPCTGWGDDEDPVHDSPPEPTWGNFDQNVDNNNENRDVEQNSWENDGAKGLGNCDGNADSDARDWSGCESRAKENNSWENNGGTSCGWGHCDCDINKLPYLESRKNNVILETNNVNCWRREGGARNSSGYKTSRFQGDKHQLNNGWRNYRGWKGENFLVGSMRSSGPGNHHLSTKSKHSWWVKKPIFYAFFSFLYYFFFFLLVALDGILQAVC